MSRGRGIHGNLGRGSGGVRGMRFYSRLLRIYPRGFRQRFEPEMLALFEDRAAAARRAPVRRAQRVDPVTVLRND